jgi:hypothetical protein
MPVSILSPGSDVASAEQVRAAREGRGWTLDEMADAVHASPLEVAACEAGTIRPPEKQGSGWFPAPARAASATRSGPREADGAA